ncbi:hypothetical protein [Enterococcus mundtii]|uniref:hypothetical protein n=1 Tax=Enterococcus mundtii TaxID=53346 RepID=UPI0035C6EFEB
MPDINGTSVGLKAVDPVFDSTGKAVLTSTDNPPGMTNQFGDQHQTKKRTLQASSDFLDAMIDWTSDFTMTYGIDGSTGYGNKGTGLYFAPLRAEGWLNYENGGTVPFPMGGTVLPALYPNRPYIRISNIRNPKCIWIECLRRSIELHENGLCKCRSIGE